MKKRWWMSVMALFPVLLAGAQSVKPVVPGALSFIQWPPPMRGLVNSAGRPQGLTGAAFPQGLVKEPGFAPFTLKPVRLLQVATLPFPASAPTPAPVYRMAPDAYYQQHFGFFCKQEWSWQKQTGLPVKLRLGSYSCAQQQEGKH